MSLSTQPYKGARDFYPEDKRIQKYEFAVLRSVAERYGYEEYDAPILEPLEIFLAKTGEEIVNEQTYTFTDRGGRQVVIRPEMTPTVSRMVAARRQQLSYPLRWYSIPNLWRYERPQRGRLREHWQLNVDLFGVTTTDAEFEIISLIDDVFKRFKATPEMYEIRINHRGLIDFVLKDYLGLDETERHDVSKLIDRMHKLPDGAFLTELDALISDQRKAEQVPEKLLSFLSSKSIKDIHETLAATPSAAELKELIDKLTQSGISNVRFDPTVMRGFDYYTGIVFEVFDTHPDNNRSMLGGGRYDGLVGLFGVEPVATVGFGWGDVTLTNFLELHSLLPPLPSETRIFVVPIGEDTAKRIDGLVRELRNRGLNIACGDYRKKLGDQIKTADKKGIPFVLIVGENELREQRYVLRELATRNEQQLDINAIESTVKAWAEVHAGN